MECCECKYYGECLARSNETCEVRLQEEAKRKRRNTIRRERDQAMRDIGMVKVRGALGGTYWE